VILFFLLCLQFDNFLLSLRDLVHIISTKLIFFDIREATVE